MGLKTTPSPKTTDEINPNPTKAPPHAPPLPHLKSSSRVCDLRLFSFWQYLSLAMQMMGTLDALMVEIRSDTPPRSPPGKGGWLGWLWVGGWGAYGGGGVVGVAIDVLWWWCCGDDGDVDAWMVEIRSDTPPRSPPGRNSFQRRGWGGHGVGGWGRYRFFMVVVVEGGGVSLWWRVDTLMVEIRSDMPPRSPTWESGLGLLFSGEGEGVGMSVTVCRLKCLDGGDGQDRHHGHHLGQGQGERLGWLIGVRINHPGGQRFLMT